MFKWLGNLVDSNDKALKKLHPVVAQINALEPEYEKLGKCNQNLQAVESKDNIVVSLSLLKNRTNDVIQKINFINTFMQSSLNTLDSPKIQSSISEIKETIKEVQDKLEALKSEIQNVSKVGFEERWIKVLEQTSEILESITDNNINIDELLDKASSISKYLDETTDKAKVNLAKLKINYFLKESAYLLQIIVEIPEGSIFRIEHSLKKFTLDALEAKTYEFQDMILDSVKDIQKEIYVLELMNFRNPFSIKIMKARDEHIKSELLFEQSNDSPQNSSAIDYILNKDLETRVQEYLRRKKANETNEAIVQELENDIKEELRAYQEALANGSTYKDRLELLEKELVKAQNEALDDLIPEAFAAVREASKRVTGLRHFDVQMMGGLVLHSGKIAEMKTGEGKTLVATLPLYLNALSGRGVHLVTVNDYLSKSHPYWMGPIYHALGMTVSSIQGQQTAGGQGGVSFLFDPGYDTGKEGDLWKHFKPITRQEAYQADITYGTNNEFGFDYLRDNMVVDLKQCVQRELNYAIVDEVDNILIDEARTPLIISGPAPEGTLQKYGMADKVARQLKGKIITDKDEIDAKQKGIDLEEGLDYLVDEKNHGVRLTGEGVSRAQEKLQLSDVREFQLHWEHYIRQAIVANELYKKNKEYVINNGKVVIVDEFTGRMMHGRRYSDGLHQAIEAKEVASGAGVKVEEETRTYATVTFQNYFRMYRKLAGMTGTAVTEAEEFNKIYKLEVVIIPTNKPMIRQDLIDKIYKNEQAKFNQVVQAVEELHKEGRPILIGTVSVEKSEVLSDMMMRKGIKHEVLNAKLHEKEAYIVAQAGRLGAVTVATNMAGRGVDIILGGRPDDRDASDWQKEHDEVVQKGGLHIIGTERHEARRIDNQLRGRAGRQGDPGSSRFYVSLEDDIMRQFGGDRVGKFMEWAGLGEDVPIENSIVNKTIESAQVRVEGYHFDIRKHLVEYDDVVNNQRKIIYGERRKILSGANLKANVLSMVDDEISDIIGGHIGENRDGNMEALVTETGSIMPLPPDFKAEALAELKPMEIKERLTQQADALYEKRETELGSESMRVLERLLMLRIIDNYWVEHLTNMDNMRQGVGLHAVAQRDPLAVYKNEGHELFDGMMDGVRHDLVHNIFNITVTKTPPPKQTASPMAKVAAASRGGSPTKQAEKIEGKKVGRNDPCPCGSGKKYKHCCGQNL